MKSTITEIEVGKTYYREGIAQTRKVLALWPPSGCVVEYALPNGNTKSCWIRTFLSWATGVLEGGDNKC